MDRALPRILSLRTSRDTLASLKQLLRLWRQRIRTRRQLATLDDRLLADTGISHSDRMVELNKPFWR
ncbi:MAG: hypothetical protein B7Z23_01505 [Pseudomonadales bacterium 32-61-5]|nr:DUF1127 domain-containing protein [Stutzerimonas stutzeri]OYW96120.1 MAG: hypothetical protein B7Z23_01505 [Pseudomonadales bacterium 32-61-5]